MVDFDMDGLHAGLRQRQGLLFALQFGLPPVASG
jgi:hypothetical protein